MWDFATANGGEGRIRWVTSDRQPPAGSQLRCDHAMWQGPELSRALWDGLSLRLTRSVGGRRGLMRAGIVDLAHVCDAGASRYLTFAEAMRRWQELTPGSAAAYASLIRALEVGNVGFAKACGGRTMRQLHMGQLGLVPDADGELALSLGCEASGPAHPAASDGLEPWRRARCATSWR